MNFVCFSKATNRNTQCYWVVVAGVQLLISYETVVAVLAHKDSARRGKDWGPTTERHLYETGCKTFPIMEEKEFNEHVEHLVRDALVKEVSRRLS